MIIKEEIRQAIFKLVETTQDESMQNKRDAIAELFEHFLLKMESPLHITENDVFNIASESKRLYSINNVTVFDKYPVSNEMFVHICMIEAILNFLNRNNALNRVVTIKSK